MALLLDRQPGLKVIGEAGSVAEASAAIEGGTRPDVAIVDLDLGDGRGVEVVRGLRRYSPDTRILVLTALRDDRSRGEALYEGASGAMMKSASTSEVIEAVVALGSGGTSPVATDDAIGLLRAWIDHLKAGWSFDQTLVTLTSREQDVLEALMDGLTDEEIAERFGTSLATVRSQVRSVLGKFEVDSRLKAVVLAYRAGHAPPM